MSHRLGVETRTRRLEWDKSGTGVGQEWDRRRWRKIGGVGGRGVGRVVGGPGNGVGVNEG